MLAGPEVLAEEFTFAATPTYSGAIYQLNFPPNDASYIPELDRLLTVSGTVTKPLYVGAKMEVTQVITNDRLGATLMYLWVYGQTGQ